MLINKFEFFLISLQKSLPYIVRKVFEIQHKLYQQHVRMCSTGRLQEALKIEDEQDFPKINDLKAQAEETQYYYPVGKAFKHEPDVGEQFTVSNSLFHNKSSIRCFNEIKFVITS